MDRLIEIVESQAYQEPTWNLMPTTSYPVETSGRHVFTPEEIKEVWKGNSELSSVCEILATNSGRVATNLRDLSRIHAAILISIRTKFGKLIAGAREINDIRRSSLVFCGGKDAITGLHLDWTEAYNIAFSFCLFDGVLAEWLFIRPDAAELADYWLKQNGWVDGLASDPKVHLRNLAFTSFVSYMNSILPGSVIMVEQHAGQMVYVPPGWIHQVTNKQSCLKLAWDVYDLSHMHYYAMLQKRLVPFFKSAMADDYMATNAVLENIISRL